MKLNKILPISFCAIAAMAVSCQNDYEPNGSCTDVAWYTSETVSQGNDYITVSVDSFISFKDMSMGCLSHKWVIEDGSKFMIDKFDYKKGMVNQIDPNKGSESTNDTESVFFGKVGQTKVTLIDTFNKWVTSHDKTQCAAEWNGSTWVLTKEFMVDVYDKMKPAFSITTPDGSILDFPEDYVIPTDQSEWKTITVYTGDVLTFTDKTTTDRPSGRTWTITGSDQKTSEDVEAKITFSKVNANGYTGFSLLSKRDKPLASARKVIPIKVIVKESPLKAFADQMSFINASTVSIPTNAKELSAISASAISDFTVSAKSSTGANIATSVKSVSIDASKTAIVVALNQSFYKDDVVTISYKGSSITTTGGVALPEFSGSVKSTMSSSLIDPIINGFEATGTTLAEKGWWFSNASGVKLVSDPDDVTNHVAMFDNSANVGDNAQLYAMHTSKGFFNVPAGTYTVSLKVKGSSTGLGKLEFAYKTTAVKAANPIVIPDAAANGWVTISETFTSTEPVVALRFGFAKGVMTKGAKIYIDDITLEVAK